ncbi:MAG: hypothetical protein HOW97_26875 [Catenulispora sp.]|nr:hypothetical protein [Catenulispora sp.]
MSEGTLPRVAGSVLADAVEALSPRLRKRLDDAVAKAAAWEVRDDEGTVTVTVDEDTRVVLTVHDGAVRASEDAVCSCLLAPACLHRAAVLGLAPVWDEDDAAPQAADMPSPQQSLDRQTGRQTEQPADQPHEQPPAVASSGEPVASGKPAGSAEPPAPDEQASLSPDQAAAAEALRRAAEELIDVGLIGAGLAAEATLRRAVHTARAAGLHLPAAIGNRVAAQLRAYRTRSQDHSLAAYADELRTVMETVRILSTSTDPTVLDALRGTARRQHEHQGGLRLVGVFSEPVIAGSGMAGVVTCVVDADGTPWSVPAVTPGGPAQVVNAYHGGVGLGGAALSHEELVREGLIVSGASASADGSLSHGAGVRAVRASGASWWEGPVNARFAVPIPDQLERILTGDAARIGDDLLFAEATILPADARAVAAGAKPGDVPIVLGNRTAVLRSASEHKGLAYADNLNILRRAAGLRLRVIARLAPGRPGVLLPLAVSPDPEQHRSLRLLQLPESWHDRICLGVDRMHASMVTASATEPPGPPAPLTPGPADPTSAIPLHLLRTAVERGASGGRRAARLASCHEDARHLASAGLPHAAAVLRHLSMSAAAPDRDAYGRAVPQTSTTFAEAWLGAALFERAAAARLAAAAWGGDRDQNAPVPFGVPRPVGPS